MAWVLLHRQEQLYHLQLISSSPNSQPRRSSFPCFAQELEEPLVSRFPQLQPVPLLRVSFLSSLVDLLSVRVSGRYQSQIESG